MNFMDDTQLLISKKKKTNEQKLKEWEQLQKQNSKLNFNEILYQKFGISVLQKLKTLEIDENQLEYNSVIGSGGFAKVYRGVYNGNRNVAIKCIHSHKLLERNAFDKIQREVIFMDLVQNHPNFLNVFGVVLEKPHKRIILELVEGKTLYDIIHNNNDSNNNLNNSNNNSNNKSNSIKISWNDALYIAHQIAKGMEYLHHFCEPKLVHRDLKSDNILISLPDLSIVKIIDFGSVIPQDMINDFNNPTGTVRWMAPEMLRTDPCTPEIDIFSFGIIMWELFFQKKPYSELNPLEVSEQVGQNASGVRPLIPDNLRYQETSNVPRSNEHAAQQCFVSLMEQCWREDPQQRPSFKYITSELQRLMDEYEY